IRIEFRGGLEIGLSTGRVALGLLRHSAIVVGACVIWLEFDCAGIIGNCAIPVVILCPGVAAVVISSRVCGAELDRSRVVGNGAGRVLLQPFGLGAVIIRGVILWIEFDRAVEVGQSA